MGNATDRTILNEKVETLCKWIEAEMPADKWIPVNDHQIEAFKVLMAEHYGWPQFTLNINNAGDKVMKIVL